MNRTVDTPFLGKDGLHGWAEVNAPDGLVPAARGSGVDAAEWTSVRLSDGRRTRVPSAAFVRRDDGSLYLPMGSTDLTPDVGGARQPGRADLVAAGSDAATTVPVVEERVRVDKQRVETGTIRARKVVRERQEDIDVPLARERIEVERIPINRVVDVAPPVRQEGDVTILSVVEEVLVVEKRLMLREEVRLTKRRDETRDRQTVTLRREEVEVTREAAPAAAPAVAAGPVHAV